MLVEQLRETVLAERLTQSSRVFNIGKHDRQNRSVMASSVLLDRPQVVVIQGDVLHEHVLANLVKNRRHLDCCKESQSRGTT